MEFVQPLREKELIKNIKHELLKNGSRDLMLFEMGIFTGLRISDILKLKVKDVKNVTHIVVKEIKTKKERRSCINSELKTCLDKYILNMNDEEYLFQSRKGNNTPISRNQAYRIINQAAKKIGITDKIGTHTLRKTFGYHHYKTYKDIAALQSTLNHSSASVTLRYIGINDDIKDKYMENLSYD